MIASAGPGNNADLRQSAGTLFEHHIVFKQLEITEVNIIPMGNDFLPILLLWLSYPGPHEPKVLRAIVCADDKSIFDMVDVILMLSFAREKNLKLAVEDCRHPSIGIPD